MHPIASAKGGGTREKGMGTSADGTATVMVTAIDSVGLALRLYSSGGPGTNYRSPRLNPIIVLAGSPFLLPHCVLQKERHSADDRHLHIAGSVTLI